MYAKILMMDPGNDFSLIYSQIRVHTKTTHQVLRRLITVKHIRYHIIISIFIMVFSKLIMIPIRFFILRYHLKHRHKRSPPSFKKALIVMSSVSSDQ